MCPHGYRVIVVAIRNTHFAVELYILFSYERKDNERHYLTVYARSLAPVGRVIWVELQEGSQSA